MEFEIWRCRCANCASYGKRHKHGKVREHSAVLLVTQASFGIKRRAGRREWRRKECVCERQLGAGGGEWRVKGGRKRNVRAGGCA